MDYVDQALYTHLGLSWSTKRSALKLVLIGIATAVLASSASAQSLISTRAADRVQVVGSAGPT
jgi:hypothetical protein